MQAFRNAILAEDQAAENEVNHLYGLREIIGFALDFHDDGGFRFFEQNGLTADVLTTHDRYIEDVLTDLQNNIALPQEKLNIIIPFIARLGQSYSELMTHSLVTNPNNGGTRAIEYAGKLSPLLNFFYAQKAKLYPKPANELKFENE